MKKFRLYPLLALTLLLLTACGQDGLYHLTWVTGGKHVLPGSIAGDLVVLEGEVKVPSGSQVQGSLHQLSGKVNLAGEILGDVSFLGGKLTLEPGARIRGDLNIGGGSYHPSPGAVIEGRVNTGTGILLPALPEQTPSSGWSRALRTSINAVLLGLLAVLLYQYFPGAVQRVGETAGQHSLVSGAMGFLVGVVGISLLITIAFTILLVPVTLLGLFVMGAAVSFGWTAMGVRLGRFAAQSMKRQVSAATTAFWGTLTFMLLLEILISLPLIGGLLGVGLASVGLGAVFLTRFGLHRFVPENHVGAKKNWPPDQSKISPEGY